MFGLASFTKLCLGVAMAIVTSVSAGERLSDVGASSDSVYVRRQTTDTTVVIGPPAILLPVNAPYSHQCVNDVIRRFGR